MQKKKVARVVVVGGGPVGASLATYLARAGVRTVIFNSGRRPPLVVGESLVPAIVPYLRRLGVEEEVASYSTYKPGACFTFGGLAEQRFSFSEAVGAKVPYSYNVPRDRFDATLLRAAREAGVSVLESRATVTAEGGRLSLTGDAAAAATKVLGGKPDWLIDAGGRSRLFARSLGLPYIEGPRKDVALHAHLEGVPLLVEGNVHTDRLSSGWCWRIPLPGRVSVGFVVDAARVAALGAGAEQQFDSLLRCEPVISSWSRNTRRISSVVRYNNYQLRSDRGVGPGWALAGDAFGFVDPVFSSGLLIGMSSAARLAEALINGGARMKEYEGYVLHQLTVWQRLVDYYYDGRLFTLFEVGDEVRGRRGWRVLDRHFQRHLPSIFTGDATSSRYSVGLLDFLVKHALTGHDPSRLQVRI